MNSPLNSTLKDYIIFEEEPFWNGVKATKARIGHCKVVQNPGDGRLTVEYTYEDAEIKMAKNPFAEGSQRLSYFGIHLNRKSSHFFSLFKGQGQGDANKATVVFKTFKYVLEKTSGDGRDDFQALVETQAVANFMAKKFNKVKPDEVKDIHFLNVNLIEVSTS